MRVNATGVNAGASEQQELERVLRQTREQLDGADITSDVAHMNRVVQSILSDMGDAVVVADKDENFLLFNQAAERMIGAGASSTRSPEWSKHYHLFLPDKVTPYPAG